MIILRTRYKVFNHMQIPWKHCCQVRKFAKVDICFYLYFLLSVGT